MFVGAGPRARPSCLTRRREDREGNTWEGAEQVPL
jgi:hypothetical protein